MNERNKPTSQSTYFRIYIIVLGAYAGLRVVFATLQKIPACHRLSEISDQSFFQFFKWIYQVSPVKFLGFESFQEWLLVSFSNIFYQVVLFFPGTILCGPWPL